MWRLCKVAGIQSVIAKRKRRYQKAGEPVGDDLVGHDFTADALDQKWLTDIERHEVLLNLAVVKGHRSTSVAAGV